MSLNDKNMVETGKKNTRLMSIITAAVLIGIGTVLRAFVPPMMGITPNFVIAMYCLAILLLRPGFSGAFAIGLVSGVVSMMTSKSPIPYLNLLTEPTGAIACYFLVRFLPDTGIFRFLLKPIFATFLGTIASGGFYVLLNKLILNWPMAQAITVFLTVVLSTAAANTVIAYVVYLPAKSVVKLDNIEEAM